MKHIILTALIASFLLSPLVSKADSLDDQKAILRSQINLCMETAYTILIRMYTEQLNELLAEKNI